jgi:hypothetical protein
VPQVETLWCFIALVERGRRDRDRPRRRSVTRRRYTRYCFGLVYENQSQMRPQLKWTLSQPQFERSRCELRICGAFTEAKTSNSDGGNLKNVSLAGGQEPMIP